MCSSNCCFLTCIQISQEASQVVWYSHLFQNFPQLIVIHTVKGFGIVNKAEIDVFLELTCFFGDPVDVGNLISGSSFFSKSSLYIRKFSAHVLLKPSLKEFEHNFASMWNECNCIVIWTFFGIAFLWDWNENWPLPVPIYVQKNSLSHAKKDTVVNDQRPWKGRDKFQGDERSEELMHVSYRTVIKALFPSLIRVAVFLFSI